MIKDTCLATESCWDEVGLSRTEDFVGSNGETKYSSSAWIASSVEHAFEGAMFYYPANFRATKPWFVIYVNKD